MTQLSMDPDMQACIDACQHCHNICLQMSMTHCLHMGGQHVEEQHLRLMVNCSELCQTTANFLLSQSSLHSVVCSACAQVCHACQASCERIGDMDECVAACRLCAETCETMGLDGMVPRGQGATYRSAH